jgi:hypothetical protein
MVIVNRLSSAAAAAKQPLLCYVYGSFNLRSGNKLATDRPPQPPPSYSFFFLSLNLWIYFFDVWCCRVCTAIRHISSLFSAIPLLSAIQILNFSRPFFGVDCVVVPFTIIKHQSRKRKRKEKKMHRYGKRERHAMTMRTEKCTRYTRDWFPPPPARFPTKKQKMKNENEPKKRQLFFLDLLFLFLFFSFFFSFTAHFSMTINDVSRPL